MIYSKNEKDHRRFIANFSKITKPFTALNRKDTVFAWTLQCQTAFDTLEEALIKAPVLKNFDRERSVTIETDASDYVAAGVLLQPDEEGNLHLVAFLSNKMSSEECNYEIYDKELLVIIKAFEE